CNLTGNKPIGMVSRSRVQASSILRKESKVHSTNPKSMEELLDFLDRSFFWKRNRKHIWGKLAIKSSLFKQVVHGSVVPLLHRNKLVPRRKGFDIVIKGFVIGVGFFIQ